MMIMKPTLTSTWMTICIMSSYWICNVSSFSFSSHGMVHQCVGLSIPVNSRTKPLYRKPFLSMSTQESDESTKNKKNLPFLLDPGTKGGALFLSLVLFIIPIIGYEITISMGVDGVEAGKWIGVGFTVVTLVLWAASYIFRVASKDMTYAKQLKDYENAVIAKRLQELDSDEVQALMEDIERDDF